MTWFTHFSSVFIVDFEHINVSWVPKSIKYLYILINLHKLALVCHTDFQICSCLDVF